MTNAKLKRREKEAGFAFIAALLATLIITSLGILVFVLTTRDIRVSVKSTGEKMAASAAESCIQQLILKSDTDLGLIDSFEVTTGLPINPADSNNTGFYKISVNNVSTSPWVAKVPAYRPIAGYEMGGTGATHDWSDRIVNKTCVGTDTRFSTQFDLDVAVGYGPIDMSSGYPATGG